MIYLSISLQHTNFTTKKYIFVSQISLKVDLCHSIIEIVVKFFLPLFGLVGCIIIKKKTISFDVTGHLLT